MANIVNRYKQLVTSLPSGTFYASDGQLLPHRDSPYVIKVSTGIANRQYTVYDNDIMSGNVTTDANGLALVTLSLALGSHEIKLVDNTTAAPTYAYVTTKTIATWLASIAQVIESIDEGVEQTLANSRLASVEPSLIDAVFGKTVGTANNFQMDVDTYREVLQEIRTAYRHYGATKGGVERVVRAILNISPLMYSYDVLSQWLLGADLLYPTNRTESITSYTSSPLTNINGANMEITIKSLPKGYISSGGSTYLHVNKDVDPIEVLWAPYGEPYTGMPVQLFGPGEYKIYGPRYVNDVISYDEGASGFEIAGSGNEFLCIEVNNQGKIDVELGTGNRTASGLAADINAALVASAQYGAGYSAVASASTKDGSYDRLILKDPNLNSVKVYFRRSDLSPGSPTTSIFDHPYSRLYIDSPLAAGAVTINYDSSASLSNTDAWSEDIDWANSDLYAIVDSSSLNTNPRATIVGVQPNSNERERVKVVGINKMAGTIQVDKKLQFNHDAGAIVYLEEDDVLEARGSEAYNPIIIDVGDYSATPTGEFMDEIEVESSWMPDGWRYYDSSFTNPAPTINIRQSLFDVDEFPTIVIEPQYQLVIPAYDSIELYKGFTVTIAVWSFAYSDYESGDDLNISVDLGYTIHGASPTVMNKNQSASFRPKARFYSMLVPTEATKFDIRLTGGASQNQYLQKILVWTNSPSLGSFTGVDTVPFGDLETVNGQVIYVWSNEPMTTAESDALGMPQTARGHINNIAPDFVWLDKFDVTDYVDTTLLNIAGYFNESDWALGTATNMEIILRTPAEFTYMKPTTISDVSQAVVFSNTGPYVATLTVPSDMDMSKSVLLENGIPVTQDNWQYNNSTTIALDYAPAGVYELQYNALIRYETGPISLGGAFSDYTWFADYYAFSRPEIVKYTSKNTVGVIFDNVGTATISEQSDMNQSTSTLIEDLGLIKRLVPYSQWRYVDQNTIEIDTSIINTSALYTLEYNCNRTIAEDAVKVFAEIKVASSPGGLPAAIYVPFNINDPIAAEAYVQIRLTFTEVDNVNDLRLKSIVAKGLDTTSGTTPMI